ncbi:unnamed protein product [Caretta caretta]
MVNKDKYPLEYASPHKSLTGLNKQRKHQPLPAKITRWLHPTCCKQLPHKDTKANVLINAESISILPFGFIADSSDLVRIIEPGLIVTKGLALAYLAFHNGLFTTDRVRGMTTQKSECLLCSLTNSNAGKAQLKLKFMNPETRVV